MKQLLKYLSVSLIIALALASCSRKGGETAAEEEKYGVSEADSTEIISNTNEIMTLLQAGDIDAAAAKIYTFNEADSTVSPIDETAVQNLHNRNRIFPVKQFEVHEADFIEPLYNAVVYDVAFGDPSPETGEAPKTKMAFNIINLDGKYYVTIMEKTRIPSR